jgi:hypothetical protein
MLTLRRTALASPAYQDWLDYIIIDDGRDVGRLYEDRHSRPEYRWFWSITVYEIIFGTVPLVQKNGSSAFTLRSSRRSFKTRISRSTRCGTGKGTHSTRLTTPEVPRATQVPDETLSTAE